MDETGAPVKAQGMAVCGAPIGDVDFFRSLLAAKADETSKLPS